MVTPIPIQRRPFKQQLGSLHKIGIEFALTLLSGCNTVYRVALQNK
jgi:hypothetical protein